MCVNKDDGCTLVYGQAEFTNGISDPQTFILSGLGPLETKTPDFTTIKPSGGHFMDKLGSLVDLAASISMYPMSRMKLSIIKITTCRPAGFAKVKGD